MITSLIIASGIMAGVYFSFSVFMMRALATLEPLAGAQAMIAINEMIVKTLFLPVFFGSTVLFLVAAIKGLLAGPGPAMYLVVAAAIIYIVGMFLVTVFGNVPMNNQLAALANEPTQVVNYWHTYRVRWTYFNHIRTLSCIVSALLLCLATTY